MLHTLITGGAGFIGSHLCERLLNDGAKVVALDDLSTGSVANIDHLEANPNFSFVKGSVLDVDLVNKLVDECDTVFHLAAAVGVRLVVDEPVRTIETNVRGSEVVLQAAARRKRRVLLTSTSEVYGKSTAVPFREDADLTLGAPHLSRWSYACSKAIDEFLALAYWSERRVPTTVVRLFNTVGPRQSSKYGMVLPRLLQQAHDNRPMTVYGSGLQTRSFCYVKETVKCLVSLAASGKAVGEVFNVGNDEEISILNLAHLVKKRTGSSSVITTVPYELAYGPGFEDMQRRVPSLKKLENTIGFRPTVSVNHVIDLLYAEMVASRLVPASRAAAAAAGGLRA